MAPKQIRLKIDIGNNQQQEFLMDKWSPSKTVQNFSRIGRYFAMPLSMLVSNGNKEGSENAIPEALLYLLNTMEEDNFLAFIKFILQGVFTGNGTINCSDNFDDAFANDPSILIEVLTWVLKEHYGCFFTRGFTPLMGILTPMAQAQIKN